MDRYPQIDENSIDALRISRQEIPVLLKQILSSFLVKYPEVADSIEKLKNDPNISTLQDLSHKIHDSIPMQNAKGDLHPLISTQEQLSRFLYGDTNDMGDCKFLTLLTAYICIVEAKLPTAISIRNYSGHPVLFVDVQGSPIRISYLHETPEVKIFAGSENPFSLSEENRVDSAFKDEDFPNDRSILFWKISEAIFVLDCMNLLRRCVVNYVFDPTKYQKIFEEVKDILNNSGVYHNSIVFYWKVELDRVKDMSEDPRSPQDVNEFKENIIKGLRF